MDKCLKYTKYAHANSVISGLSDLIDKEIIAKSKYENEYFINPLILFNGSRVTFAKTFIKKSLLQHEPSKSIEPLSIEAESSN